MSPLRISSVLATFAIVSTTIVTFAAAPSSAESAVVSALPPAPTPPALLSASHVVSSDPTKNRTNPGDGQVYWPLTDAPFIVGHDNGQSATFTSSSGQRRSFWSFGDTGLDAPNDNGQTFIGNTGAFTDDLSMPDNVQLTYVNVGAKSARPSEFIELSAAEKAYNTAHRDADPVVAGCQPAAGVAPAECGWEYAIWGSAVVDDSPNGRLLALYGLILRTPGTGWGVTGIGTGVAVWTEASNVWTRQTISNPTDPSRPTMLWPYLAGDDSIDFDKMSLVRTEGGVRYLYVYSCSTGFKECKLARVSLTSVGAVTNRAAYTFLSGVTSTGTATWSSQFTQAVMVPRYRTDGSVENMSSGAAGGSVFRYAPTGDYMSIYGVPLSNDIVYSVAKQPWGPWSPPKKLATAATSQGTSGLGSVSYAMYAHPEYAADNGRTQYVTYAHLTSDFSSDFPIVAVTFAP